MNYQMLIVFGILAVAVGLFIWGRPRADIVGLLVVIALMASRVLTPDEALAGFGSPVVMLLAAIFIISAGLDYTGVTQRLGELVVRLGGSNETRLVALLMLIGGIIGSVLNSAAVMAIFIPIVLAIASKTGLNRKRMLMPLCVAVMISGMMTLIAASHNVIIYEAMVSRGIDPPLGFFSFAPFGLVALAISIVFMLLVGRNILSRERSEETGTESPGALDMIGSFGVDVEERWHRLKVLPGSPLIGETVSAQREPLRERYGLRVIGFELSEDGKTVLVPSRAESVYDPGDVVIALVADQHIPALTEALRFSVIPRREERELRELLHDFGVAEVMPAPDSGAIGKTLGELDLASNYRLATIAIHHRGRAINEMLTEQTLDFGDILLVGGNWEDINRLSDDRRNFVLLNLPAEYQERLPARRRATIAVAIVVVMVAVMALQLMHTTTAALLAAAAMIATRCVRVDRIYRVVSWNTLVLIAGMLPLATALTKTGATERISTELVRILGPLGPILMLAVVFLVTALVCLFIANAAAAVLIAPIVLDAAQVLDVSPQAFAMTVAIACSAAFVTPVSSPTNMLVMEPGGYRFGDYVKVGLPMLLLTMLATVAMVTVIYL